MVDIFRGALALYLHFEKKNYICALKLDGFVQAKQGQTFFRVKWSVKGLQKSVSLIKFSRSSLKYEGGGLLNIWGGLSLIMLPISTCDACLIFEPNALSFQILKILKKGKRFCNFLQVNNTKFNCILLWVWPQRHLYIILL